jgi:transglutaminase-like putative cysteine protease
VSGRRGLGVPSQAVAGYCSATRNPKVTYSTRKRALTAAAQWAAENGHEMAAYKCRSCKGWHITKMTPHPTT